MVTRIGGRRPYRIYLAEWIESKGLTQDQMAARMDCSPGTVSKLVGNKMARTPEWLARFAYALGPDVEVHDLFRDPDRPSPGDLLRGMPDDEQDKIIRAIRALTGTDN